MTKNTASDIAFIHALADLLNDTNLAEIKVEREYGEDDALSVRLTKYAAAPTAAPAAPPVAAQTQTLVSAPAGDLAADANAVTSPMVGTIFLAPEPDAAVFVKVDDEVTEGQTLLIIEAMKTMNQIPSPRAGIVRRILVENGQPVEFGAPMMVIE